MKKKVLILVLASLIGCALCGCVAGQGNQSTTSKPKLKQIYNHVYEFIDNESGMTPRLNTDGSIMVDYEIPKK